MKLSALQQTYAARRANGFRGSSLDSSADSPIKSSAGILWLILHGFCCLISLVLGFRFSRLVFFLFFSTSNPTSLYLTPFRSATNLNIHSTSLPNPIVNKTTPATISTSSSRVVVGRHGIRIRPWPHPNPIEVMKAHQIIETVQREQRRQFGVKNPRKIIAITPTYVRTLQALHMTGVMHSLMLVPYPLVWIVVEAGGITNETASILAQPGLETIHVGFNQRMPNSWEGRHRIEAHMRLHALRIVSKMMLDGTVIFVDDSNLYSMEFFDEIQSVKWFGALSVGIIVQSDKQDELSEEVEKASIPAQGPACNSSNKLVGWHTFNALPYAGKSAKFIGDKISVLPRKLEWSGFVLNSKLLWKDAEDKPEWVNDFDTLDVGDEALESPLFLLKDALMVEPLGSCGRQVLVWWLRVEARFDSKFPHGWLIGPPLEITVPAKRTPWPDIPPELPTDEKAVIVKQEETSKHPAKTHSSRSRRSSRSKRKRREPK
ncbi:probable beta-1,4-xylosyltransferase IRX14 [Cucurbita maxima]|uniref:Glycosyltransferases n=1 Tax=Cucurbita maxima TaxID=3661 RepID=A0A6J1KQJ7_CUCMA|nr:probable beta-1,4-xylosyltransferase IRX14 [Cucurbita maxima]